MRLSTASLRRLDALADSLEISRSEAVRKIFRESRLLAGVQLPEADDPPPAGVREPSDPRPSAPPGAMAALAEQFADTRPKPVKELAPSRTVETRFKGSR